MPWHRHWPGTVGRQHELRHAPVFPSVGVARATDDEPDLVLDDRKLRTLARGKAVDALKKEVTETILERFPEAGDFEIAQAFDFLQKMMPAHGDGKSGDRLSRSRSQRTVLLPEGPIAAI